MFDDGCSALAVVATVGWRFSKSRGRLVKLCGTDVGYAANQLVSDRLLREILKERQTRGRALLIAVTMSKRLVVVVVDDVGEEEGMWNSVGAECDNCPARPVPRFEIGFGINK